MSRLRSYGGFILFGILGLVMAGAASAASIPEGWRVQSAPAFTNDLLAVAYGDGRWVAVGGDGYPSAGHAAILVSSNAIDWISRPVPLAMPLQDVVFGGGKWVAVSEFGNVLVSSNTVTWSEVARIPDNLLTAAYANGLWVVGGEDTVYISADATNWQPRVISANYESQIRRLRFGGGLWVGVGDGFSRYVSQDAINWTFQYSGDGERGILGLSFGGGYWLGSYFDDESGSWRLIISTNGLNWNYTSDQSTNVCFASAYENGAWVAVGWQGRIVASTNAIDWIPAASPITNWLSGICSHDGLWVAVGEHGMILRSSRRPVIRAVRANATSISFSIEADSDASVSIESSSNLRQWTFATNFPPGTAQRALVFPAGMSQFFYRAVSSP